MKIPEKITIAGITYTVEKKKHESPELNYGILAGCILYKECKIFLDESLNEQTMERVFLHEVLHGIFHALDICDTTVHVDERFTESSAQLLYQVVKQVM